MCLPKWVSTLETPLDEWNGQGVVGSRTIKAWNDLLIARRVIKPPLGECRIRQARNKQTNNKFMASVAFCRQFDNKNNCQKKRTNKEREKERRRERQARANKQSKCQPPKTIFQANIYKSERELEVERGRRRRTDGVGSEKGRGIGRRTDARRGQPLEKDSSRRSSWWRWLN